MNKKQEFNHNKEYKEYKNKNLSSKVVN